MMLFGIVVESTPIVTLGKDGKDNNKKKVDRGEDDFIDPNLVRNLCILSPALGNNGWLVTKYRTLGLLSTK